MDETWTSEMWSWVRSLIRLTMYNHLLDVNLSMSGRLSSYDFRTVTSAAKAGWETDATAVLTARKLWGYKHTPSARQCISLKKEFVNNHFIPTETRNAMGAKSNGLILSKLHQPKYKDHCSSEECRCTHVGACVARTWILYPCVLCHTWCTLAHIENL
jgi:hypothetical protein